MANSTLADIDLEPTWEDLIVTHASAASVNVRLQNVGNGNIAIVEGGGSAPNGKAGTVLQPLDSVVVNAAAVWMRALETAGRVSVTVLG